jgi:hypothetical protein
VRHQSTRIYSRTARDRVFFLAYIIAYKTTVHANRILCPLLTYSKSTDARIFTPTVHLSSNRFSFKKLPNVQRFLYVLYNSHKFNSFYNCTLWSIKVVIALGMCAHRTPAGVRERHTCIGLMKSTNFIWKHHFHSWTSVALNMCELNTT